jgi:hypothetical protein
MKRMKSIELSSFTSLIKSLPELSTSVKSHLDLRYAEYKCTDLCSPDYLRHSTEPQYPAKKSKKSKYDKGVSS